MATISTAITLIAFMLVVAVATASPMQKEKMKDCHRDLAKATRYLWNEKNQAGKNNQQDHMIMGLWNENMDDNQNKREIYAMRDGDDSENDSGSINDSDDDKDGKEAKGVVDTMTTLGEERVNAKDLFKSIIQVPREGV